MFVKDRRKVLARPEVFEAIKTAIPKLRKWNVLAGVIMPNHVHWVVVKDNPVRHGFVHAADEWPYYLDFINEHTDRESCQLPLQFKGVGAR